MKNTKPTAGGARSGARRKKIYGEETERIFFTVPVSKKELIVKKVESMLEKYKLKL